ncbi:MAG: nucleotide exchange factor GrpE [Bacteroidetes bacterium]|nr:nucleotide exchange factor GrpE [Bacteroidota bacterium]
MDDQNTTKTESTTNEQQQETPGTDAQPRTETEILNGKIAELETQLTASKDLLLRKAAEFDNYKRRTEQNNANFAKYAGENIILELLPIIDDLSRSLKSVKDLPADGQAGKLESDPFYKGVELILNKFSKVLESQGVKAMVSVGKEFNVDFHDVMMQVPRRDVASHTIVDEIEKGYFLHDKVIRHAKVIVATSPESEEVKN